jgi:hypothetical protein
MAVKMPGEFQKRDVLLADRIDDSDRAACRTGKAEDGPSGASELSLEGLYGFSRGAEMSLVEVLQNIHFSFAPLAGAS